MLQVAWGLEMAELARAVSSSVTRHYHRRPNYDFRSIPGIPGFGMLRWLPWSLRVRLSVFASWAFGKLKLQAESQLRSSKSRRGCEPSQGRPAALSHLGVELQLRDGLQQELLTRVLAEWPHWRLAWLSGALSLWIFDGIPEESPEPKRP